MTHFSLTEKRKRRKAGRKEGRREKREEGKKGGRRERKKEGKKERRQKKECKCVFRHFQFHDVVYPPPLKVQIWIKGWEKMTHFSLTERRKKERKEARRKKREEGKKGGRKVRKKEGKIERREERNVNVYKFGSGAGKKMTHFSLTEKRKRRKEGGKKRGGKERREEGLKEGRKERKKERRQKKECKCVFRHYQFHIVDSPPPPQSTNLDQELGKK